MSNGRARQIMSERATLDPFIALPETASARATSAT